MQGDCYDNQAAAFNLRLLMRSRFGVGTPRSLQGLAAATAALADASARSLAASVGQIRRILGLLSLHAGSLCPSGRLSYNKTTLTRPPPLIKLASWQATSSAAC